MTLISKAQLAEELLIAPPAVSRYVREGMPVRADGRINREAALDWVSRNRVTADVTKGSNRARRLLHADTPRSPLDIFVQRLRSWRSTTGSPIECTLPQTAEIIGVMPEAVLTWLRAGAPFVSAGDLSTGGGFALRPAWIADFHRLAIFAANTLQDHEAARRLHLSLS